jgi:glutathione S-transferase
MSITLYDASPSANSDRVKIVLHEKGLAYQRVTLDLAKKEQKRPEFLKLNPYGKVPVINDNGKVLFESCIINEYLDEQYPNPPLMPKEPYVRGRGRILVDYGLRYMHEPYWALRGEVLKNESERDQTIIAGTRRN